MYIKVDVLTSARKETMEERKPGYFDIQVKEPAKMNKANKRVLSMVARHFKCPIGKVRIINGHHSPSKLISLDLE